MILTPGRQPPYIVPYCQRCDMPVERFNFFPVDSPHFIEIEGQCCGATQGARVSVEEIMRIRRAGEKLFLVTSSGKHEHHVGWFKRA